MGFGDILNGVLGSSESFQSQQDPYLNDSEKALENVYEQAQAIPTYQKEGEAAMGDYNSTVNEMQNLGRSIGDFSPGSQGAADFNMRYQPALARLTQDFDTQNQNLMNQHNERGIIGGTPTAYDQSLNVREYGRNLDQAMQEAMSGAEQQRLGEYQARSQAEPAMQAGKITNQANVQQNMLNKNAAAGNAAAALNASALKSTGINTDAATAMRLGNQKFAGNMFGGAMGAGAGALAMLAA